MEDSYHLNAQRPDTLLGDRCQSVATIIHSFKTKKSFTPQFSGWQAIQIGCRWPYHGPVPMAMGAS